MRLHVLAVPAALLSTLALAPVAHAGTYPMRACNVPGAPPAGTGPWAFQNAARTASYDACGVGGAFGFSFPAARSFDPHTDARLRLVRPAAGPQAAIGIRKVRLWMSAALRGTGGMLLVLAQSVNGSSLQSTDIYSPPGGDSRASPWISPTYADSNSDFDAVLYCAFDTNTPCVPSEPNPLLVYGAEATLVENVGPGAAVTGGPLVSGVTQGGTSTVAVDASDGESGVARVEVLLGGVVAGTSDQAAAGRCAYASWNACPGSVSEAVPVNTALVPNGAHTVQVRVTDAAGNEKLVARDAPVSVFNGPAGSSRWNLSVGYGKRRLAKVTRSWRSSSTLRGRLTEASGAPIAGAQVRVTETAETRARRSVPGSVTRTARDGTFSYVVRARRASRSVRFAYGEDGVPGAAVREVRVRVRAASSLRVALRGTLVRYRGRLLTGPIPRGGVTVQMQGRAKGGRWTTFARRHTTRKGTLTGRYRLRARRPGVRLQFRMVTPTQRNYPYVRGTGATATRRVR